MAITSSWFDVYELQLVPIDSGKIKIQYILSSFKKITLRNFVVIVIHRSNVGRLQASLSGRVSCPFYGHL